MIDVDLVSCRTAARRAVTRSSSYRWSPSGGRAGRPAGPDIHA